MGNKLKQSRIAGGVVLNNDGDILVVSQSHLSWSLPKGHIEESEDALGAARREIYEESGVTSLEFVKSLGNYQRPNLTDENDLYTIFMFLFRTKQMQLKPIDPENPEARWVKKDQVAELLTAPKDKEFILRALKKISK